jgi:hypothetical protein
LSTDKMSAANPNERKTANHVSGNGRSFRFRRLELIDIVFCRTELAKDMAVLVAGEQQVRNDLAAPIAEMVPDGTGNGGHGIETPDV